MLLCIVVFMLLHIYPSTFRVNESILKNLVVRETTLVVSPTSTFFQKIVCVNMICI